MSKLSLFFSRTSSVRLLFSSLFLLVFLSFYILTMCRLFNAEFLKSAFSRTIYWVCWVIEIDRRRFIQQFVDIITQFLGYFLTNFFSKVQMGRMKTRYHRSCYKSVFVIGLVNPQIRVYLLFRTHKFDFFYDTCLVKF